MNRDIFSSDVLVKIDGVSPIRFEGINSKVSNRVTIDYNKGKHFLIRMHRKNIPQKLLLFIYICSESSVYVGGVNIIELINESISSKDYSSIARDTIRLKNDHEKDGAIISFKLRVKVKSIPVQAQKSEISNRPVAMRSADFYHTNQQYRQICYDLREQVRFLENKVSRLTGGVPVTDVKASSKSKTLKSGISSKGSLKIDLTQQDKIKIRRTRPNIDLDFDGNSIRSRGKSIFESTATTYSTARTDNSVVEDADSDGHHSISADTDKLIESSDTSKVNESNNMNTNAIDSVDVIHDNNMSKFNRRKLITSSDKFSESVDSLRVGKQDTNVSKRKNKDEIMEDFDSFDSKNDKKKQKSLTFSDTSNSKDDKGASSRTINATGTTADKATLNDDEIKDVFATDSFESN